jgi:hypothetical protein
MYGLVRIIGTRKAVHSVDGGILPPEPVTQDVSMPSGDAGNAQSGDVGNAEEAPAVGEDCTVMNISPFLIHFLEPLSTLNMIYQLYINDPGDYDFVDEEEDVAGLQAMANFLHDIRDI